ncbi:hypothetical protein [Salirhabdus sp. Marseille-P4669]|uniref:hypothetical protein n=1 Tax=Salirhabdus sp. Marseille-P4669 TaxID=2042310 RepID=UPI000C7A690A|nr:hypothetical protein [Salirhabdus sp. Marseille-P4669]
MSQPQNNQYNQPNSTNMPSPPNMISTKDQMYLADMLSWNLVALKKAHFYAQQCQNEDVKSALNQAGQMHQKHYNLILEHLNKNPSPQVSH